MNDCRTPHDAHPLISIIPAAAAVATQILADL
jgi:hypothetical protein